MDICAAVLGTGFSTVRTSVRYILILFLSFPLISIFFFQPLVFPPIHRRRRPGKTHSDETMSARAASHLRMSLVLSIFVSSSGRLEWCQNCVAVSF